MRQKELSLTNFSHAITTKSLIIRPDNEQQLSTYLTDIEMSVLARGAGLSYSDSCFNNNGLLIDCDRLNHFISFDSESGIVVCQAATLIKDLFFIHSEFIPPVFPGTLYATVGGCIAHDVHGKNNPQSGSFGHHVLWLKIIVNNKMIHCSREEHSALFYASIAGLGLTGVIVQAAIRMQKISPFVSVEQQNYTSLKELINAMRSNGLRFDYQVAWLDLMRSRSILSLATYCPTTTISEKNIYTFPKLPFRLINSWNIKLLNSLFFYCSKSKQKMTLQRFNNPLDSIKHWNRVYGKKGLIQFQAVFQEENAVLILEELIGLIKVANAVPILTVLKLFQVKGEGLLSFCKPGFTIAIDFINNCAAKNAIRTMNHFITTIHGRVYLAKDLLLTPEQYQQMYPNHTEFKHIRTHYQCNNNSNLAQRLGITS